MTVIIVVIIAIIIMCEAVTTGHIGTLFCCVYLSQPGHISL
jgi:hypothetical protein